MQQPGNVVIQSQAPERTVNSPGVCCDLPASLRLQPQQVEQLSALLKALGHPVRLQIVDLLSRFGGQVCVCDVESQFDLSQPTISHHLKILREAGLIAAEQRGLWIYYFTRPDVLAQLVAWMAEIAAPVAVMRDV